jgi:trk system potassium uptake protein TrkH
MSVTARTAGFNTIDYAQASDGANFLTVLLMFMGGSPGSTAGGIKTTTVALIGLLAWSRFRGRAEVSVRGRTLRAEAVQRAVGLAAVAFALITAAILLYVVGEGSGTTRADPRASFLAYMFEATSAFNTVGLSMGVTADLSPGSRWLTIVLMYLGRVGPLAFAASIALPHEPRGRFRYAYEDVVVG